MADATLSTSVSPHSMSRRSMVVGASALAAPALIVSAATSAAAIGADPDAALLRRIAAAERYRAELARACAACERLYETMRRHPDYSKALPETQAGEDIWDAIAGQIGIPAADGRCDRLHELCEAAADAAFDTPARTLPGLQAKTRLAVTVVKDRHPWGWEHIDCDCLDRVLADLERMAAGRGASVGASVALAG